MSPVRVNRPECAVDSASGRSSGRGSRSQTYEAIAFTFGVISYPKPAAPDRVS